MEADVSGHFYTQQFTHSEVTLVCKLRNQKLFVCGTPTIPVTWTCQYCRVNSKVYYEETVLFHTVLVTNIAQPLFTELGASSHCLLLICLETSFVRGIPCNLVNRNNSPLFGMQQCFLKFLSSIWCVSVTLNSVSIDSQPCVLKDRALPVVRRRAPQSRVRL